MKKSICLVVMILVIVSTYAFSVEIIDRKLVAGGAEVVLELVKKSNAASFYQYSYRNNSGIDWIFYQKALGVQMPGGEGLGQIDNIGPLWYNNNRISFSLAEGDDFVVVTLDTDASSPKMHEDRFIDAFSRAYKGADLEGVDKVTINDPIVPGDKAKTLERNKEGQWCFEGIVYEKNLKSKTSAVPLPSMNEEIRMTNEKADSDKADAESRADVRSEGTAASIMTPSQEKPVPIMDGSSAQKPKDGGGFPGDLVWAFGAAALPLLVWLWYQRRVKK